MLPPCSCGEDAGDEWTDDDSETSLVLRSEGEEVMIKESRETVAPANGHLLMEAEPS